MAGFMSKLGSYLYEGELKNGAAAAVKNGTLMVLGTGDNKGKLVLPSSADTTSKFLLKNTDDLYNSVASARTGYRFIVNKLNANYYLVENGYDVNSADAYNTADYETAVGELLRAHPLEVGEEFITDRITGTLTVGTEYGVKTDGTVG